MFLMGIMKSKADSYFIELLILKTPKRQQYINLFCTFHDILRLHITSINNYLVYLIPHYVIRFVSYLRHVGGFLKILRFPPPIKLTAMI